MRLNALYKNRTSRKIISLRDNRDISSTNNIFRQTANSFLQKISNCVDRCLKKKYINVFKKTNSIFATSSRVHLRKKRLTPKYASLETVQLSSETFLATDNNDANQNNNIRNWLYFSYLYYHPIQSFLTLIHHA